MKRLLLALAPVVLVLAPAAAAGGWATVQLSAVPKDGTRADTNFPTNITVLQHGQTPLDGVTPVFRIRDGDGTLVAEYRGTPTGEPGVYRVDARFPEPGTFRYEVYDGFEQYGGARVHRYAPVEIAPVGGDGAFPLLPVLLGAGLALALGAVLVALARRGRAAPEAATQP